MNHFKTFFYAMILGAYLASFPAFSQLERALTVQEIKILTDNVRKDPSNIKSRLFLATHYYNQNQWTQVINFLNPISERLPDTAIFKLATAYMNVEDFRQSQAIVNILLSRENIKTKHYLLAIDLYSKILVKLGPEKLPVKPADDDKPVAKVISQQEIVTTQLFDTLKLAQKNDPENPKIYDRWLEYLEKHIDHYSFDALSVVEDMKKNNIRIQPRHLSLQCKYSFLSKFTKQTKLTCQKAMIHDPENPANYIYLGQIKVNIGEEKEGKRMLASVGKKFSKSHEALFAAADSYYQSKNLGEAYKYYLKADKHSDANPDTHLGLARTAFELKKYGVALQAFSKHCFKKRYLHHEFRRASGHLKNNPKWQEIYRQRMMDCKPKQPNTK